MSQSGRKDGHSNKSDCPGKQRRATDGTAANHAAGKVDRRPHQTSAGAINKCSSLGNCGSDDDGASCLKLHGARGATGKHNGDSATPNRRQKKPATVERNNVNDSSDSVVRTVEILKRPGQTLGFYIREGNGCDRSGGVFISRIGSGSVAENNALLRVGDEIVSINGVNVTKTSLDDVVLLLSIAKRLVLKLRTRVGSRSKNAASCPSLSSMECEEPTPVVVLKGSYGGEYVSRRRHDEARPDVHRYSAACGGTKARMSNDVQQDSSHVDRHMPVRQAHRGYNDDFTELTPEPGARAVSSQSAAVTRNNTSMTNIARELTDVYSEMSNAVSRSSSRLRAAQDANMTFRSPQTTRRRSPYACLDYASDTEAYGVHCVPRGVDNSSVRAFQDEIKRTHHRYEHQGGTRHLLNESCSSGHRTGPSPESYNSDSEVHSRNRKWAVTSPSGKHIRNVRLNQAFPETGGGGGGGSNEELKHWLKKFDNLSHELAGSDNTKSVSVSPSGSKGKFENTINFHFLRFHRSFQIILFASHCNIPIAIQGKRVV